MVQFKVEMYRQREMHISLLTGNYSRVAVEFMFTSSHGYYQLHVYLPSFALVALVYISMFLSAKAPLRLAILVLAIVAQVSIMEGVYTNMPKISYMISIDLFFGKCLLMFFIAFIGE